MHLRAFGSTNRNRELKMTFRLRQNMICLVWNLRSFSDVKMKISAAPMKISTPTGLVGVDKISGKWRKEARPGTE